jgi:hypothetical protein
MIAKPSARAFPVNSAKIKIHKKAANDYLSLAAFSMAYSTSIRGL